MGIIRNVPSVFYSLLIFNNEAWKNPLDDNLRNPRNNNKQIHRRTHRHFTIKIRYAGIPIFQLQLLNRSKIELSPKNFDIRTWIEALPIAFVAILETLISAKIADQLTNTKFDKEAELRTLGIANVLSGFLGGIPVTAALARTSLNINSGCTFRFSSLILSLLMFLVSHFFMNYFSFIPMPVIAAQVCIVAVRLVNFQEIAHLYKHDKQNFYLFAIIVVISL